MSDYIDVILTQNGSFCVAPPWTVKEGDLVGLPNALTGANELQEVIAVSTDEKSGNHIKMVEKYVGCPLPRITAKYFKNEVDWDEDVQE